MNNGIVVSESDRGILRGLAEQTAELAELPVQKKTAELWSKLNGLRMEKPMVYLYQVCWGEMNYQNELTPRCEDSFLRTVEQGMRRTLYQWEHMRADMVIEPFYDMEPVLLGDDYGLEIKEDVLNAHPDSAARSHHYIAQIKGMADVEKIKIPSITFDEEATSARVGALDDIFGDVLPVRIGINFGRYNIAPWDRLVHWTGVTEILLDLAMRPDYVHALMEQLTRAHEARIDQFLEMGQLAPNNRNMIIGQGGYGYTDELPGDDYDPENIGFHNLWGGGMAQVFSEVSPDMHEEFALDYEIRCMNRFGLVYYGCCEPLHHKVDLARRKIPRLRKISMSPMADDRRGAEAVGDSLVYSCKPNPAYLATDPWNPEAVRAEMKPILEATKANNCNVEIILKDISTVHHDPRRLWEWAGLLTEIADSY